MRGSRKVCQWGSNSATLTTFFLEREDPNTIKSGPSWGPPVRISGIRSSSIAKKPYIFCDFSGGSLDPLSLPSGSAHNTFCGFQSLEIVTPLPFMYIYICIDYTGSLNFVNMPTTMNTWLELLSLNYKQTLHGI